MSREEDIKIIDDIKNDKIADFIFLHLRNMWSVDGLYFLGIEEKYGTEIATEIDKNVWKVMGKIEARRLKDFLNLKDNTLSSFIKCLKYSGWFLDLEEKEIFNAYRIVRESGNYQLGLINDILNLSKVETGKIEIVKSEVNICKMIDSVVINAKSYAKSKEKDSLVQVEYTIDEEVPELFFTPDLVGYGWVFRKGDYLNIGLGREDKSKLSSHVKAFCDYLVEHDKIPAEIADKFNGHAYLLYNHALRKMVADHVLLIGDSAGLAYPQSGEGIRPAVESAILAAEVIMSCDGDYGEDKLQDYVVNMQLRFGKRMAGPDLMERLPMSIKRIFASQLLKTHWFTRDVVVKRWFLQSHQLPLPAIKAGQ